MSKGTPSDDRERISRMEAIAYIESLLPELVTLAASQPRLQSLLQAAHLEARQVVDGFGSEEFASDETGSGVLPTSRT